jgi:hypothetical protein
MMRSSAFATCNPSPPLLSALSQLVQYGSVRKLLAERRLDGTTIGDACSADEVALVRNRFVELCGGAVVAEFEALEVAHGEEDRTERRRREVLTPKAKKASIVVTKKTLGGKRKAAIELSECLKQQEEKATPERGGGGGDDDDAVLFMEPKAKPIKKYKMKKHRPSQEELNELEQAEAQAEADEKTSVAAAAKKKLEEAMVTRMPRISSRLRSAAASRK